jgi:two-component system OmpR family sensor kinase
MSREEAQPLAVLVHEVRSPAAALRAIAEAYRNELEPAARRTLVPLALAACRAIDRIVTDAAVTSVRLAPVDLGRVAEEAVAAARLHAPNIRAIVEPALPLVDADVLRIRQALDNLLGNAVTHGASGGEIVVRAQVRDRELLLVVSDSGPGIPAGEQERILEKGVRLEASQPGSGLGLTIVRAIADAHRATLRVDSAPGRGATFTLAFPLDQAERSDSMPTQL